MKEKKVEGNMNGDGLAKGGIFVISPGGEVKFVFHEDPGKGVPETVTSKIIAAAKAL